MTAMVQPPLFVDDLAEGTIDKRNNMALPEGVVSIRQAFDSAKILATVQRVIDAAPLRHMHIPGGKKMSVAMSNCGDVGWISNTTGYAYSETDPDTDRAWPPMPALLADTATRLAAVAGYDNFAPDACLINRYCVGAQMGLHQDRDEEDFSKPIVSLSLGLTATFMIGGLTRRDRVQSVALVDGDAIIFGGAARLRFHGVRPLKSGHHALLGDSRINLTFRVARGTRKT
jgi:DNA oxidative demethylase